MFVVAREAILKTAKALVEDTKTLVAGAASNQEQLASAAQNAVKTITKLADVVKLGAASLSSEQPEAQVSKRTLNTLVCIFRIFDHNFDRSNDFTKYMKDSCW